MLKVRIDRRCPRIRTLLGKLQVLVILVRFVCLRLLLLAFLMLICVGHCPVRTWEFPKIGDPNIVPQIV